MFEVKVSYSRYKWVTARGKKIVCQHTGWETLTKIQYKCGLWWGKNSNETCYFQGFNGNLCLFTLLLWGGGILFLMWFQKFPKDEIISCLFNWHKRQYRYLSLNQVSQTGDPREYLMQPINFITDVLAQNDSNHRFLYIWTIYLFFTNI